MQATFENTYPNYPFAPLVRFGIELAARLHAKKSSGGSHSASGNSGPLSAAV